MIGSDEVPWLLLRAKDAAWCAQQCFNAVIQCLFKARLFGLGLLIADFAVGSDVTYITSTYATQFGCDSGQSSNGKWILLMMSTTNSASQPGYAILASMFNRRQVTLVGTLVMSTGFLFCFCIPPMLHDGQKIWFLALAQGIVSLGSAAFASLPDLVLNENLDLAELGTWKATETAIKTLGSFMGGPMGAVLASKTSSWYSIFLLEATIAVAAVVVLGWDALLLRASQENPNENEEDIAPARQTERGKADPLLMLCVAAFVLLPTLILNLGTSTLLTWTTAIFTSLLVAITFAVAVSFRIRRVSEAARPWSVSSPRKYAARLSIDGLVLFAYTVFYITLSSYAKVRAKIGTGSSDWALPVVILGDFVGLGLAAITIGKTDRLLLPLKLAMLWGVFMFGLLSSGVLSPEYFPQSLTMVLLGMPKGFISNATRLLVIGSITEQDDGNYMYGLFSFVVQILGSNLAITLAPIFFEAAVKFELHGVPGAKDRIDDIMKCPTAEHNAEILRAVVKGHEWVFLISMACLALCFACVLSLPASTWTKASAPRPNEVEPSLLDSTPESDSVLGPT